jgi:hypothetical protein
LDDYDDDYDNFGGGGSGDDDDDNQACAVFLNICERTVEIMS